MSIENNHLVIMAGGVGSRFWPMSTHDYPKQFIDVLGCGRTMIQLTVDRFKGLVLPENIWVVTAKGYADVVKEQLPEVQDDHILLEPCRKNTAPCIAYVSWKIKVRYPHANMVVTPSDHVVMDVQEFQRVVKASLDFTWNSDAILTLGMKAIRPETGYGYIEADLRYPSPNNKEVYRVDAFKEKPTLQTAERYVKKNNFFWNAGIFIWNVSTVVNAFRVYEPGISELFENLQPYYYTEREQEKVDACFEECESISIDYAIMERADEIFVFPAHFGWSDLGTWGSLHDNMKKDGMNNVHIGENIFMHESYNCVVHTTEEKKVVIQGLDGYIVAEKNDCLLICKLGEEQRIREFSEE